MTTKVIGINTDKLVNDCYPVAISTDDGNTVTLVPRSLITDMAAEYEKAHLQPTRLDLKALITLAASFQEGVTANDPELLADMEKLDPPQTIEAPVKSVSATGRDVVAQRVSKLLASNTAAVAAIEEWMMIGEKRKVLPAQIPYLLQGTFTKEVRADMPVPGSIKPEKYKGQMLFDRADDKPGTESWYVGAVEDVPGYWERIGTPLRKLGEVLKKDSTVQNEYTKNGVTANADLKRLLEQQKRDMVTAFRDAIETLNIIDEVHAKIPGMNIYFRVVNGVMERTLSPLRVVYEDASKQKGEAGYYREKYLSVGALRRIDLATVYAAADKFEAFKPARGAGDDEEEGIAGIQSAGDLEKVIGWLSLNEKNPELKTMFRRRLNAPPSESDPLLRMIAAAKSLLDDLLDSPKLRTRINTMLETEEIQPVAQDRKVA